MLGPWQARRLVALQGTDCRVAYPLQLIARLYRIGHLADAQALGVGARNALRGDRSRRVLEKLHRWLVPTLASEPPSSEFAKAVGYLLHHWPALTRFVEDGLVSLDNNCCEQQLRAIAIGRKNYLFAGSHAAAERAAGIYSLMRTCAQHGVAPLPYLTGVLRQLSDPARAGSLTDLLPDQWQARHDAQPVA